MFTATDTDSPVPAAPTGTGDDAHADLQHLLDAVTNIGSNASDAVLIDRITALERLKSGCAAAQARLTATFADSVTADAAARHHRMDAARRSIAGQIGLARRDSPFAGRRHVGVAAALVTDMPHTLAALARGDLSERRARTVVEQFACLTPTDRREADRLLAPDLPGLGDRTAETRAAAIAMRLDPETVMAKIRGAVKDRHVTVRPAPDTMTRLSALLPVSLGVAVYAALCRAADTATAAPGGDPRNRGQLMADALVSAVTGHTITGCDDYGVPQYTSTPATATDTAAPDTTTAETDAPATTDESAADAASAEADAAAADTDESTTAPEGTGSDGSATSAEPGIAPATATDTATTDTATTDTTTTDTGSTATDIAATVTDSAPNGTDSGRTATATGPTPRSTAVPAAGCTGGCGTTINLIMTDRTLLDCDDEPAHLQGFGPVPAALARALVIGAADTTTRTWIRRLYTDPITGQLTAMDSKRRLFPAAAQRFLLARDQTCRTPWCDAPIREYDHLQPHADNGPTTIINGRGACKACNLTKESPGWSARSADHTIHLTAPTGHSYPSNPPHPPRSKPWADISHTEHRLAKILLWQPDPKTRKPLPRSG